MVDQTLLGEFILTTSWASFFGGITISLGVLSLWLARRHNKRVRKQLANVFSDEQYNP